MNEMSTNFSQEVVMDKKWWIFVETLRIKIWVWSLMICNGWIFVDFGWGAKMNDKIKFFFTSKMHEIIFGLSLASL